MYLGTKSTFLIHISTFEYVTESNFCGLRFFRVLLSSDFENHSNLTAGASHFSNH